MDKGVRDHKEVQADVVVQRQETTQGGTGDKSPEGEGEALRQAMVRRQSMTGTETLRPVPPQAVFESGVTTHATDTGHPEPLSRLPDHHKQDQRQSALEGS